MVLDIIVRMLCILLLCESVKPICRFGSESYCAFPCNCQYNEQCNQDNGHCYWGCAYGRPTNEDYRWHGPGCRQGNVAYDKPAVLSGPTYREGNRYHYASLAVDGNVYQYHGSCARTDDNSNNRAWIYVDLQSLHKITSFTLVNKQYSDRWADNAAVLGKMKIGLSNTTTINDATPYCYHLTGSISNGGISQFSCTTNNVGRYFYLYRDWDGHEKSRILVCEIILNGYQVIECSRNCKTTCHEVTGCERCEPGYKYPSCYEACDSGWWGDNCQSECSWYCSETCDKETGHCITCRDGYFGDDCRQRCPDRCKDNICDRSSGDCTNGCDLYYWGRKCTTQCSSNCKQTICDSTTGRCSNGCRNDQYWGYSCETRCNQNCERGTCYRNDGTCSRGCNTGFYGSQCKNDCPINCHYDVCDITSGTCTSGCKGNYVGDRCERLCPGNCVKQGEVCDENQECIHGCVGGYWGEKCESLCPANCVSQGNICDDSIGNCLNGCNPGYWYVHCNQTCPQNCDQSGNICNENNGQCFSCKSGFWGDNCDQICRSTCSGTVCNKPDGSCINGCFPGYYGNYCNNTCSINCNQTGQVCDDETGECFNCSDGYWDLFCNRDCSAHCASKACSRESAHCINGCMETESDENWYIGDACNQVIPADVMARMDMDKSFDNGTHIYITWNYISDIPQGLSKHYGIELRIGQHNITFTATNDPRFYMVAKEENVDYSSITITIYRIKPDGQRVHIPNSEISEVVPVKKTEVVSGGPDIGVIAGAAVGAVVLIIIAVIVVVVIFLRKRKDKEHSDHMKQHKTENNDYIQPPHAELPLSEIPEVTHQNEAYGNESNHAGNGTNGDYINIAFSDDTIDKKEKKEAKKAEKTKELPPKIGKKPQKEHRDLVYENTETQTTKVRAAELENYLQRRGHAGIKDEYGKLKASNVDTCTVALTDEYGDLNRYKNILPYNHSRVKLRTKEENDYINASYIRGYKRKEHAFIASQGPNPDSVSDMWLMIWESKTTQIVMVTKCVENIKRKCEEYWPRKVKQNKKYGDISITCSAEIVYANYTIKTLTLEKGLETREVHHFHFLTWPDKTPPEHAHSIVEFRNKVRSYDKDESGPMVVHCSAGVGRTGTLIALDVLLDMIDKEEMVDVFNVVNEMRKDRMNMVQTLTQYEFLYEALVDTYKSGTKAIPSPQFIREYRHLQANEGMYSNQSKLQEQFKILQKLKASPILNENLVGLKGENRGKNRDNDIIPENNKRIELFRDQEGMSNYINALFVSTHYNLRGLIVTQEPLPETIGDFWSMVYDYKCPCLVYIRDGASDDGEGESWLPVGEYQTSNFGEISVTSKGIESENFFMTRDYALTRQRNRGSHSFRVIEMTWDDSTPVPNVRQVLAVLDMMDNSTSQNKQTGPPIIMCRNGATKSGLIAASLHVRQRFQTDKDIDIMNSVRVVSAARPQFIPTQEQYHFLYSLVNECIQDGDVYANV